MLFSVLATITLERNMKKRMKEVLESKKEAENSLDVVSKMSASLREGINNIYAELELLKEAAHNTNTTMEEVSLGAADTAQAVQSQIIQTEAIQNKVDDVDGAAENIAGNISHTLQIIDEADVQIKTLIESVDVSVENGSMAASRLEKLNSYIDEMNMIIELINSIADQTSLLALNANIEAARAGEVGKGFAVVANEISQMANQTSEATVQITQLIQNVGSAIKEVVDVIYTMIEGINDEKVATGNTAKGLSNISNDTHSMDFQISVMILIPSSTMSRHLLIRLMNLKMPTVLLLIRYRQSRLYHKKLVLMQWRTRKQRREMLRFLEMYPMQWRISLRQLSNNTKTVKQSVNAGCFFA